MCTPFTTRVALKIQKIARDLNPTDREFRRIWPLINSVEGFLDDAHGRWLFKAARALPEGSVVVEIGSFKGRSTSCLALGCLGGRKRVYAIDRFDGGPDLPRQDTLQEFSENIRRCSVSGYVEPLIGFSSEVAKTWNKPIHLLFIDGSHQYEDVLADFTAFYPHVVAGGIIAVHDIDENWLGVVRAWNETIKHQLGAIGYCTTLGFGRKRHGPTAQDLSQDVRV